MHERRWLDNGISTEQHRTRMGIESDPRAGWIQRSLFPRSSGTLGPVVLAALVGVTAGIGAYTFSYAKGLSYFGTDPKACVNCHIMEPEYAAWQKSSHHAAAVCVDCHLPASFFPKYIAKAENGYRHGKLFTTQTFEEPITVKAAGLEILQDNCERCHARLVESTALLGAPGAAHGAAADYAGSEGCLHCHWTVGHGGRAGVGGPLRAIDLRAELEAK